MPNQASPTSPRYTGLFFDQVNGALKLYYKGNLVKTMNATTDTEASGITLNTQSATLSPNLKVDTVRLGTTAAVASNGAAAILPDVGWVVPSNYTNGIVVVGAWRQNMTASDVTTGTAVSSASFRRVTLITNTAGTGSGTNIVASLDSTASAASLVTRSFTTVASTVPAGAVILASHLTVGAATADGTDMAASIFTLAYSIV